AAGRGSVLAATGEAFGIGVLISAFLFGFRHGIDWDHIAAITDITGSQEDRRSALLFGTLYALGHALVVFVIGCLAIVLGERLHVHAGEGEGVALAVGDDLPVSEWHHGHHGRPGHHHHKHPEPDAFMSYGKRTAFVVGMIHGVGAETPTQIVIFLAAAGAGG